jgi:hypothetical protein
MVQLGHQERVRDSRTSFQAAASDQFVAAVEAIVHRTVRAFASGIDPDANVVFESCWFEPHGSSGDGIGTPRALRARELG